MLAYRNDDIAQLNTGIRDQRLAAGEFRAGVTRRRRQYDQIAHGYEVTIHRSQKATVDRTYVLAVSVLRTAPSVAPPNLPA